MSWQVLFLTGLAMSLVLAVRCAAPEEGEVVSLPALAFTGANCIYLQAVRFHGGDGDRTHNPFLDNNPAKGLNPKVLDQWEGWFAEMDRRGIVVAFFFYDDSARIWDTGDRVGPAEERFIRALVDRFRHHRNLIWCVAEEYQEAYSRERVSRIAAVIRAADQHRHPIAVHQLNGLAFHFPDDPAIDQFAIQYNVADADALHAGLVRAFRAALGRLFISTADGYLACLTGRHPSGGQWKR